MKASVIDRLVEEANSISKPHPDERMMVYHCVLFNAEFDWLAIQRASTRGAVDKLVVVEGNMTFSGKPKPRFLENALASNDSSIISEDLRSALRLVSLSWIPRTDPPWNNADGWQAEAAARRACALGMSDARPGDAVISDTDEVPDNKSLLVALETIRTKDSSVGLECQLYYYNYQWHMGPMGMPVVFPAYKVMQSGALAIEQHWRRASVILKCACKHCSYCFGPYLENATALIASKLASFSHTEFSGSFFRDPVRIRHAIETGIDLFHGHRELVHFTKVNPEQHAPQAVLDNQQAYGYLLGQYRQQQ